MLGCRPDTEAKMLQRPHPTRFGLFFLPITLAIIIALLPGKATGDGPIRRLLQHRLCHPRSATNSTGHTPYWEDPNKLPRDLAALLTPEGKAELIKLLTEFKEKQEASEQAERTKQAKAIIDNEAAAVALKQAQMEVAASEADLKSANEKQAMDVATSNEAARRAKEASDEARKKQVELAAAEAKSADDRKREVEKATAERQRLEREVSEREAERDRKRSALNEVKNDIDRYKKDPLKAISDDLKGLRDRLQNEWEKAVDAVSNAHKTLADKKTYFEWREKAQYETEKLKDNYLALLDKFGTEFEKNVLSPLLKAYKETEKRALQTRDDAVKTAGVAAESVRRFDAAKETEKAKKQALRTRDQLVEEAKHSVEQVKQEVKNAAEEVKKAIDLLANQELIVYQINTPIKFSLNMHTGGYYGFMDLDSLGITWDTEKVRELIQGNFVLPEINPIQLAASSYGTKLKVVSEYRQKRDDYVNKAGRLSYFASERFVDWAGGESVVRFIGSAILGKGDQAIQEAKAQLHLEFDQLYSWLKIQGREVTEDICAELLLAVLEGRSPTLPQMRFDMTQAHYLYEPELVGACFLPKPLRDNIENRFKSIIKMVQGKANQHFAYGVAVEYPDSDERLKRMIGSYSQFEMADLEGIEGMAERVFELILAKTANPDIKKLLSDLKGIGNPGVRAEKALKSMLASKIGLKPNELLKWYVPGKPIINLTSTPIAAKFEPLFKSLPMGNKGSVSVSRLEFNLTTYTFNLELNVTHCHSWGSMKDWFN